MATRAGEGFTTAIGVISGTSMDGIDVALIESDGEARARSRARRDLPLPQGRGPALARGGRGPERSPGPATRARARRDRRPCRGGRGVPEAIFDCARRASRWSACTARPSCIGRARLDPPALRRRARGGGARRRCGRGLPFGRRQGRRRGRAARAGLSRGDGRGPRAPAHDPQLGRGRQRHLSRPRRARSSPSTPARPMR